MSMQEFMGRYPFPLDPFQIDAIEALWRGQSVFVAAPTGTGKTIIAEYAVWSAMRDGKRVVYTTPLKALSNQKFRDFRAQYGNDAVGLMTGDLVENPRAPIIVMTTEVYRNMLLQGDVGDIASVVFDEVHYLADPERGTAWEEAIILAPPSVCLVCLSATVPNATEVAAWIAALRQDVALITSDRRAVPTEYLYYAGDALIPLVDTEGNVLLKKPVGGELARAHRSGWHPRPDGREGRGRPLPMAEPAEVITRLGEIDRLPALYFLFGRKLVEDAAASCRTLPRVPHADELLAAYDHHLAGLPAEDRQLKQVTDLRSLLPHGLAFHHGGMMPVLKVFVEEQFAANRLRVCFATDTLALGVNMPARTVVIAEPSKFDGERRRLLTPNELRQMSGRAGRRGMDNLGTVVILYSPLVSAARMADLARGELWPLESAFSPGYNALINLWQPDIGDRLLVELTAASLKRFQRDDDLRDLGLERFRVARRLQQLGIKDEGVAEDEAPPGANPRADKLRERLRLLDEQIEQVRYRARRGARRFVRRLEEVLGVFGYMTNDKLTSRAKWLERIFDTNSLTLAEILHRRLLDDLPPDEVAEVVSWFAFDRELPVAPDLPWTTSLTRARRAVFDIHDEVLRAEAQAGVAVSRFLPDTFAGPALLWAQGRPLAECAALVQLAEGDVISGLQKTLDLLGQLRDTTLYAAPKAQTLAANLQAAARLIRRGIIEHAYQMVLAPAEEDETAEETPAEDAPGDRQVEEIPTPDAV
ncbi:MAG: DEAD/DEAH box helicase [Anaerolineae bacterium]|nr:DEAD/DEAH box helicase [Anaerolineae bacterium]